MKRILIIGDSWAIIPCNIYAPQSLWARDNLHWKYDTKNNEVLDWLDFRLLSRGHSVSNRSYGGNANWFQLGIAETYLNSSVKNNFHIDLVIWFHTELLRDMEMNFSISNNKHTNVIKKSGLEGITDYIATETYNYAKSLHELSPLTKWAIIGGHAPIHKQNKDILSFADFVIDDYRSEITGTDAPECHTLSFSEKNWQDLRDYCDLPLEIILEELDKKKSIEDMCSDLSKFYDGVHPSPDMNKLLSDRIIKHFDL